MINTYPMIRRTFFLIVPCVAVLSGLLLSGCERRDPEAEFNALAHRVFNSPQAGEDAAADYIEYFNGKANNRVEEAKEIQASYVEMEDLLNGTYTSYEDFYEAINRCGDPSKSRYEGVRLSWNAWFKDKKRQLLEPVLAGFTKEFFSEQMQRDAKYLCDSRSNFWASETCEVISISEPQLNEDGFSKSCTGVFRVDLRGKVMGLLKGSVKLKMTGKMVADEPFGPEYHRVDYEFLEKPTIW